MPDQPLTSALPPAQQIALWADQLRDMAAVGSHFAQNIYDRDRYAAIQNMVLEMLAYAMARPLDQLEPLQTPLLSRPTPLVAGNAAVIDDDGRILLMQRSDNRQWHMPGGALEVGETPAAGVVREVLEETGVRCAPVALVGIYDSRLWDMPPFGHGQHLYKFTFLCKPLDLELEQATPSHAIETLGSGWFAEDELPEGFYEGHRQRLRDGFRLWRGEGQAHFDP
ncbi:MAG: NUDIX hydrolase N-terminal domain-containing protein [Herpetosiphonaceae bacterium]|nr:NUDIX hydrolase N-terminal domain-containing protein [Herpetosiphonaceae bacterium]